MDINTEKWNHCLERIRENVAEESFDALFSATQLIDFRDGELILFVPSPFYVQMFESKYYDVLKQAIGSEFGDKVTLSYRYPIISGDEGSNVTLKSAKQSLVNAENCEPTFNPVTNDIDPQLNPVYNFENYCVGKSNHLPFVIAEYIANHPDKSDFNPFFLYGSVGVGKTHLIQAIGIRLKERNPQLKVFYIPYRQFQHEFAMYTRAKRVPDFINRYEQIDVLLIDDLQEIATMEGTMKVLFPIFNHLHQRGRKLVFTSDRPPGELEGVTDRLIDRFKWGVVEELPKPDFALRKQILQFKAKSNGLNLPDDVIEIIASRAQGSVREIEGIVMGIITRSIAHSRPIDKALALEVLQHMVKTEKRTINFDMIVETTAEFYKLNPDVIFSKSRVRDIADARQLIMYLCKKHTGLSSSAIGQKLNRRHATVLHAVKTITGRLPYDKELAESIATIEDQLKKI